MATCPTIVKSQSPLQVEVPTKLSGKRENDGPVCQVVIVIVTCVVIVIDHQGKTWEDGIINK